MPRKSKPEKPLKVKDILTLVRSLGGTLGQYPNLVYEVVDGQLRCQFGKIGVFVDGWPKRENGENYHFPASYLGGVKEADVRDLRIDRKLVTPVDGGEPWYNESLTFGDGTVLAGFNDNRAGKDSPDPLIVGSTLLDVTPFLDDLNRLPDLYRTKGDDKIICHYILSDGVALIGDCSLGVLYGNGHGGDSEQQFLIPEAALFLADKGFHLTAYKHWEKGYNDDCVVARKGPITVRVGAPMEIARMNWERFVKETPDEIFSVRLADLVPALAAVPEHTPGIKSSSRYLFNGYVRLEHGPDGTRAVSGRGATESRNEPIKSEAVSLEVLDQSFNPYILQLWYRAFPDARLEISGTSTTKTDDRGRETTHTNPAIIVSGDSVVGCIMPLAA